MPHFGAAFRHRTSEMVAAEVKALYEQHGAACVGLSETQLCELRVDAATAPPLPESSPAAPRRLAPMVSEPVLPEATAGATMPTAVPSEEAGTAPAAPGAQGAVMQKMLEAQAAARAKQEQLMNQMVEQQKADAQAAAQAAAQELMKLQKAQLEEQDREMVLLAQELKALGSTTDTEAAGAAGKKSSTCALQ
jgi:hypothetical protein